MTNNKPATPLPWKAIDRSAIYGQCAGMAVFNLYTLADNTGSLAERIKGKDAAYIAHACNAYPKLVEALRECMGAISNRECPTTHERISALLRDLGEGE